MTNERLRIVPAVARLDAKPRKPTKVTRFKQQRELKAWQRKAAEQK
ncbi:hypothetical protein MFM001_23150 [Mycobacterium sp. MFM001]|nr:hypothetical protein [Mycobacterium sp. MFM001]GBE65853.1 hypothetical protein MFM001_23150 [Mycobacterium sp. MFM001]